MIKRIMVYILLFLIALIGSGYIYQAIREQSDRTKFPPPGKLVSINNQRFHINCSSPKKTTGKHTTIVMEAGSGGTSLDWAPVFDQLKEDQRVCTYDRAGMSWSEPNEKPRTVATIAGELNTLLNEEGITGPKILVGHSFGGLVMQYYARRHPESIRGLVLVDAVHEDMNDMMPAGFNEQAEAQQASLKVGAFLSNFGLVRLLGLAQPAADTPDTIVDAILAHTYRAQTLSTIHAESVAFDNNVEDIKKLPPLVETLPITVISRTMGDNNDPMEVSWQKIQEKLAGLTTTTQHIQAASTNHYVQFAEPELVTKAIIGMLEK